MLRFLQIDRCAYTLCRYAYRCVDLRLALVSSSWMIECWGCEGSSRFSWWCLLVRLNRSCRRLEITFGVVESFISARMSSLCIRRVAEHFTAALCCRSVDSSTTGGCRNGFQRICRIVSQSWRCQGHILHTFSLVSKTALSRHRLITHQLVLLLLHPSTLGS